MKIRVTCDVDSVMQMQHEERFPTKGIVQDDFDYRFSPGGNGRLNRISIEATVTRPHLFDDGRLLEKDYASPEPEPEPKMDEELIARIRAEFQSIESHLSFKFPLTRIAWEWPTYEFIPETPEEESTFRLRKYSKKAAVTRKAVPADREAIWQAMRYRFLFPRMSIPLSFYREGLRESDGYRFISAFFNFYFVLEGLFGAGKTKNRAVEKEFLRSRSFQKAVPEWITSSSNRNAAMHERVRDELDDHNHILTTSGVARYLVNTRGKLHHFSNNPGRVEGTPFTHQDFEVAAYTAQGVTEWAVYHELVRMEEERNRSLD